MLNGIWLAIILAAVVCGAATGTLGEVTVASVDSARSAVELALGLVGMMALWLGLVQVLHRAGLLRIIARLLRPIMVRLFPDVPADHPAMSMMILNMTANALGLANAATPFGLKAMMELQRLNPHGGTATNAMALFLAINTSNLALLPTGMIGLRTAVGARSPGSIILTSLAATAISTLVAVVVATTLSRLSTFRVPSLSSNAGVDVASTKAIASIDTSEAEKAVAYRPPGIQSLPELILWASCTTVVMVALGTALYSSAIEIGWTEALKRAAGEWLLVVLMVAILLYGWLKKVAMYDAVVEGGKEGFSVALKIIPFLVAILVAVGMLRASGGLGLAVEALRPVTAMLGIPSEALPMALLRPLTGTGAYGIAAEIMQTYGADSLIGNIVSTMQGSTETTFYVLALYFGVVGIKNPRHTIVACLSADFAGVLASVWACRWLLSVG